METLVIVSQHRNQYESRSKSYRSGSLGSTPSKAFKAINCRTFHSGNGLLPTPKPCTTTTTTPVAKKTFSLLSLKTPSANSSLSEEPKGSKRFARSSAVSIPIKLKPEFVEVDKIRKNKPRSFNEKFDFSELWAGPAYSNSPPPSSLPIPKFSFCTKRTVSLELPSSAYDHLDLHPLAKSAPASPTRAFTSNLFDDGNVSATKDLCRILNLDISDE